MTTLEHYAEVNPAAEAIDRASHEQVAFVPMSGVSEEGKLGEHETRPLAEVAKGYTNFVRGDVLMAKITPCMENGKAALVSNLSTRLGFGSTEFHVLRARRGVDARFLFYLVWNQRFREEAAKHMTGSAGQKRVPASYLKQAKVPLIDAKEQRRIADILDKADAIRRKRKEAIALTEELLRSAFLEMFGDPVTNPKGWPLMPLAELGRVTTGNTPSRAVPEYFGNDIEWIKSDNINTPGHYLTRATEGLSAKGRDVGRTAPAGSTLMTCIAGSPDCIGNVALADRAVAFNQQINAVTPHHGVDHRFLYVLLLVGKRLVQAASTNSMKGMVSKGKLEDVLVPVPPPKAQAQFGEAFDGVWRVSCQQEVAHRQSQALFDSTAQRAFSGALESTR